MRLFLSTLGVLLVGIEVNNATQSEKTVSAHPTVHSDFGSLERTLAELEANQEDKEEESFIEKKVGIFTQMLAEVELRMYNLDNKSSRELSSIESDLRKIVTPLDMLYMESENYHDILYKKGALLKQLSEAKEKLANSKH